MNFSWIRCRKLAHMDIDSLDIKRPTLSRLWQTREKRKASACVWSGVSETKACRISLSLHVPSFPYVPLALLPIHHISLWARQLSGAEANSQFSSPSNCSKYSNSSVKPGVEGWERQGGRVVCVNPANLNPFEHQAVSWCCRFVLNMWGPVEKQVRVNSKGKTTVCLRYTNGCSQTSEITSGRIGSVLRMG